MASGDVGRCHFHNASKLRVGCPDIRSLAQGNHLGVRLEVARVVCGLRVGCFSYACGTQVAATRLIAGADGIDGRSSTAAGGWSKIYNSVEKSYFSSSAGM